LFSVVPDSSNFDLVTFSILLLEKVFILLWIPFLIAVTLTTVSLLESALFKDFKVKLSPDNSNESSLNVWIVPSLYTTLYLSWSNVDQLALEIPEKSDDAESTISSFISTSLPSNWSII